MSIGKYASRIAVGVAAATMAVLGLAPAQPALAGTEQCNEGWFCMWENNQYTGYYYGLLNADSPNVGNDFNDKMTSYWNRSPHTYLVFFDTSYGGGCSKLGPGWSNPAVNWGMNDQITSARRWRPGDENTVCNYHGGVDRV
ncbi:peptidase inhibitor family I36 protein [Catenuloplanes atrovinosus]|uniref:Peptidase inhibitor family I36 n=1 Tax=Catenuloplanes atrovinosus TaxID=137266 RepID=A0AAE4CAN1_9ACTN|nr:peptidase inhibitor family I36 protein [Catenuloplanes atrovinosus]MDR7277228.1 hypothetical protein [Catenuloplanes atrovinosus]